MVFSQNASLGSARTFLDALDVSDIAAALQTPVSGPTAPGVSSSLVAQSSASKSSSSSSTAASTSTASTSTPASTSTVANPATIFGAASIYESIEQSFAIPNGIVSFDQGVTADRKIAALSSMTLARMHADSLYPAPAAPNYSTNWFATYINTLINIGWVVEASSSGTNAPVGSSAEVSTALLKIVEGFVGVDGAAGIQAALSALTGAAQNSQLTLFQQSVGRVTYSEFSSALATADPSGDFLLKCSNFNLSAKDVETSVLFFSWGASKANIDWSNVNLTLDESIYNPVKYVVSQKIAPILSQIQNLAV